MYIEIRVVADIRAYSALLVFLTLNGLEPPRHEPMIDGWHRIYPSLVEKYYLRSWPRTTTSATSAITRAAMEVPSSPLMKDQMLQ